MWSVSFLFFLFLFIVWSRFLVRASSSVSSALFCAVFFINGADIEMGKAKSCFSPFYFFRILKFSKLFLGFYTHISKRHHPFLIICFSHRKKKYFFKFLTSCLTFQTLSQRYELSSPKLC